MVETHRFFRFSLYGGDSPAFLGFHFMVETHLRQFFVYNKYMQFSLKNRKRKIASTLTFLGGCFAATDI